MCPFSEVIQMKKSLTSLTAFLALFLAFGAYACGTSNCDPAPACGPTGCYQTDGNMNVWLSSHSAAYGDEVLAASGGRYNFTTILGETGLDTVDFFNLNGGFMSLSEGTDWVEAGGYSVGEADWYKYFEW